MWLVTWNVAVSFSCVLCIRLLFSRTAILDHCIFSGFLRLEFLLNSLSFVALVGFVECLDRSLPHRAGVVGAVEFLVDVAEVVENDSVGILGGGRFLQFLGGLLKTAKAIEFDIVKAMGFQTSIANTDLAEEIATETMGRIQAESVVLLQIQGKVAAARALQLLAVA